ncbi:MAG: iron-enterobactin ABC transporter permease [Proteobacteria bacterium]|nr:iron-enterobactin ABC transporter permease [Pseudomonadota bacterium]
MNTALSKHDQSIKPAIAAKSIWARRSILIGKPDGVINFRLNFAGLRLAFILALACLLLGMMALKLGALSFSNAEVFAALKGEGSSRAMIVINQWRLPRVLMALVIGAALGMSGAIFQSLVRNPLGSPDVIGFGTGAHTGALITIILLNGGYLEIATGAIIGGLLTALLVYLLAWRQGIHGFRLIIVGIAVSAMLAAFNTWLSITGSLEAAMSVALWAAGSLNGMSWAKGLPAAAFCLSCMLLALLLGRRMQLLEMGDDSASALGIPAERTRLQLMALGVALIAAATAATGPIAFIALVAPQIVKRIGSNNAASLYLSALMGALLLLLADLAAQHLFFPQQFPVGIITVSIGGVYLIWLLLCEAKRI